MECKKKKIVDQDRKLNDKINETTELSKTIEEL